MNQQSTACSPATGSNAKEGGREHTHIEGLRFVAALWVVGTHLGPPTFNDSLIIPEAWSSMTSRCPVMMVIFFVVSGFVMYSKSQRVLDGGALGFARWYLRRIHRLLLLSWCSMCIMMVLAKSPRCQSWGDSWYCFSFARYWTGGGCFQLDPWWTTAAFLPLWLVYPFIERLLDRCDFVTSAAVCGALWLAEVLAIAALCAFGPDGSWRTSYFSPLSWLGDFSVGMLAAHVSKTWYGSARCPSADALRGAEAPITRWARQWYSDAVAVLVAALLICLPDLVLQSVLFPSETLNGTWPAWTWMAHLFAPLVGSWLVFSHDQAGLFAQLLAWPPLVWLGGLSMHIYLIHVPYVVFFQYAVMGRTQIWAEGGNLMALPFAAYCAFGLSCIAVVYAVERLERPVDRFLRKLQAYPSDTAPVSNV